VSGARAAALAALADVLAGGDFESALATARARVAPRDGALVQALVFGVLRHFHELSDRRDRLLARPGKTPGRTAGLAVLLGLYELAALSTPAHAAVDEAVAAVRHLGAGRAAGFVNAVLRRAGREGVPPLGAPGRGEYPEWFARRCEADWGALAPAVFAAGLAPAPLTLRANRLSIDRRTCLERLAAAGMAARAGRHAPDAVILDEPKPVSAIPGFEAGQFSVQDEAAQLAPQLMDLAPGQRVLDACAAPGGKTGAILEACPQAAVVALERDPGRLARVRDNLDRLGLAAELRAGDAGRPADWAGPGERYERILLDAPCTASGVVRRHPDIRLRRRPQDLRRAVRRQQRLLDALWPLLAPGGRLVYATCSIFNAENAVVAARFLDDHDDATGVAIEADWGRPSGPGRQILPGEDDMDGFYYAVIIKSGRQGGSQ